MKVEDRRGLFFCGKCLGVCIRLEQEATKMPDSVPQWEALRTDLFRPLAALGDFRRGPLPQPPANAANQLATAPNLTIPATPPIFG